MEDTICAISTSMGIGAISIVRVTGPEAINIVDSIFDHDLKNASSHTIHYGHIKYNEEVIDEVLVMLMRGPKTYTTEDTIEINCHGGINTTKKIMEVLLASGCRLAEPGEFTKRAYLNGRINLLEAESVNDLIVAKTDAARTLAINNVDGKLSKQISTLRDKIAKILANIEVNIDYPEYTDELQVTEDLMHGYLNEIKEELDSLVSGSKNGRLIKNGVNIAIIGKPNAGKSSLLNRILKEDRAIVTQYEGTTRDTIEELVNINGIPLKLIDTAGIRNAEDEVEKIGINKSKEIAKNAELIIAIFDSSKELSEEDKEILDIIKDKNTIIVLNKIDLNQKITKKDNRFKGITENILEISALNNTGIEKLYKKITEMFELSEINLDNELIITNIRHKNLITKALNNIQETKITIKNNMPIDIVAVNIKEILENLGNMNMPIDIITIYIKDILEDLGEITGEVVTEDIINEIFSKFCLGK